LNYTYRQDLDWLITDFTARVVDVAHAVVVSADGVPLALSEGIPQFFAEQLAAITAGLVSLMQGAARIFEAGLPTQALVEMEGGLMIVKAISDGSSLAVLAALDCDTDLVAYEMTRMVEAVGEVLTPAARAQQAYLGQGRPKQPGKPKRRRPRNPVGPPFRVSGFRRSSDTSGTSPPIRPRTPPRAPAARRSAPRSRPSRAGRRPRYGRSERPS
jgi:predicted regulator of Ras-like GTPase activity (Roadblock/LC7/MglB family)